MKHKNTLLVAPENWAALKKAVPGLAAAAKGAHRDRIQTGFKSTDIKILNEEVVHEEALRILRENGLRPVGLREALFALIEYPELMKQLKGKDFWVDSEGMFKPKVSGFHTILDGGYTRAGKSDDPERNIYHALGSNPPLLIIDYDKGTAEEGRRFYLNAALTPTYVTDVVVGLPFSKPINSICENARRQS